jgi:Fanconi-associated nuclease 1
VDALLNNTFPLTRASSRSVKAKAAVAKKIGLGEGAVAKESQRVQDAREVLAIFEVAYTEWKALGERNYDPRPHGLERFDRGVSSMRSLSCLTLERGSWGSSTGHVLTRIVQKGADAFGTLKEYDRELDVLEALLSQRRWRRGRRGKWYERRALILMRYCDKTPEILRRAVRGLLDSLNDQDTHLGEWPHRLVK